MKKGKILVLGCGPAGLLVAHACILQDWEVTILSKKARSYISGAQYLHSSIPGLTYDEPDGHVIVEKLGTPEGYARKIYGDAVVRTSWQRYHLGKHFIWNLRIAYEDLWKMYHDLITDGHFLPSMMPQALKEYRAVFSTMPLTALFPGEEKDFKMEQVWLVPQQGVVPPCTITWNGLDEPGWYRSSNIFGHESYEYPRLYDGDGINEKAVLVNKPLAPPTGFRVPFEELYLFGRYGQWKKGVLVDDAYREAYRMAGMLE